MPHPSAFYKYASAETAALVLEHSRIRWSSPTVFNDLSEFQRMPRFVPTIADSLLSLPGYLSSAIAGEVVLDIGRLAPQTRLLIALLRVLGAAAPTKSEVSKELLSEVAGADGSMEAGLREFIDELDLKAVRVLCVTTEFDNEAMWANYASNHTGCVLGFRHIPDLDTPLLAAVDVDYSVDQPVVGSGLDFLLYGASQELICKTVHAICFTKKAHWAYEKEWRAITHRTGEGENTHSDFKFYSEELESLTLGPRINPDSAKVLARLANSKYPNCDVYRLEIVNGRAQRHKLSAARGA